MKDPYIFLQHILESIHWIEKHLEHMSEEDFLNNVLVQDAVVRRLEIIGEATRNIPATFKRQHPEVPWNKILGTRNVLIHEYFGVDTALVWGIIQKNVTSNIRLKIFFARSNSP